MLLSLYLANCNEKRIAITGVGVVSSAGIGNEAFWNSLLNGVPKNGFLIEDFDPLPFFDGNAKEARRADRFPAACSCCS